MVQKERSRKNLKIGVGIFIVILGILNTPMKPIEEIGTIESIVTSVAWVIVGILIILGTGKIKKIFGTKKITKE